MELGSLPNAERDPESWKCRENDVIFVQTHCFAHQWKNFVTLMLFISLKFASTTVSEDAVASFMKHQSII